MEEGTRESPEDDTPPEHGQTSDRKATLGIIGMVLALVGMIASIAGPHIVEELYPPQKIDYDEVAENVSGFVADVAVKTSRKLADAAKDKAGKLFSRDKKKDAGGDTEPVPESAEVREADKSPEPVATAAAKAKTSAEVSPRERAFSIFRFVGMGGGIFALFLGLFGWVRGEDHRAAIAASAMGFLAMAWVYVIAALALAIIVLILGSIFD